MKSLKPELPKKIKSVDVPLAAPAIDASAAAPEKITLVLGSESKPNQDVTTYNHAAAQEKAWKTIKEASKPAIEKTALTALYAHNTEHPEAPVKTVCLTDSTGASCNVSLKDTYGNATHDPKRVTDGLLRLGQSDPNKFVAEKVVIGFDTSVFHDEKGALRTDFYLAVMQSLQEIAAEHKVPSPFSSTKVVQVKEGFAESRWQTFTEEQQPEVSLLFPATVSLTPLAPAKKPKG